MTFPLVRTATQRGLASLTRMGRRPRMERGPHRSSGGSHRPIRAWRHEAKICRLETYRRLHPLSERGRELNNLFGAVELALPADQNAEGTAQSFRNVKMAFTLGAQGSVASGTLIRRFGDA